MTGGRVQEKRHLATAAEFVFRPAGFGRLISAVFLLIWICGWAVGEGFALWILLHGARSLLTGEPPAPGREPLEPGPAVATGAFLLIWLTFWTFGGWAAISEFLRLTWGEDRIQDAGGALVIERRRGPFLYRREIPRGDLRRLYVLPKDGGLQAETAAGSIHLTALGTRPERESAAGAMNARYRLDESCQPAQLPEGWQEIVAPEGEHILVPDLEIRRKQALVSWILAAVAGVVSLILVAETFRDSKLLPIALISSAATAGIAWGALWLTHGRVEWRLECGRLVAMRRFGSNLSEIFTGRALELTLEHDSDGDPRYALEAVATDIPESTRGRSDRRSITRVLSDPTVPRRLGAWLANRSGVPFKDRG